ncbi:MAG: ATP-binding protein [Anaerocolumna sp.]
MDKKNKGRARSRLFLKVYINYAIMLTVLAVLVGLIFMNLYKDKTIENYKQKLLKQAASISDKLSTRINDNDDDTYREYIEILEELDTDNVDIWTISNPNAASPMDKKLENVNLEDVTLPKDCTDVIEEAFKNVTMYASGYYEEFGGNSAILGMPVSVNGEVVGAILLRSSIKDQEDIIQSSMYLIVLSVGVALFISFIIAILFAKGLSTPISKMRNTALELADGKYESKTEISRKDEIGDLARTIDVLADELKENEIERESREQARVDFFANVSHELRTPITVIRAYAESLVDGVITDEEKVNQYYLRILTECKGMERLVGDLLILSKMQNPDFAVEKEPINILQVFDDLLRSIHAISHEKKIKIEISKDHPYYMMMGDYDRLRQMFLIILDNAIKFSNVNTTIHIILSKVDKLTISIRDEGIGISPDDLSSIFDKFYKSKLKQNEQGSGLGLAIAKQIALKHGGTVEVYSTLGTGTEFVFTFQCLEEFVEELNI